MKTILKIKLNPSELHKTYLLDTMNYFNSACNFISNIAFNLKKFTVYSLHKHVYNDIRLNFNLSAQLACRAISKVCDSYKINRKVLAKFSLLGSVVYDDRILSFKNQILSICTTSGRIKVPMVFADFQSQNFHLRKGQADLVLIKNQFYLYVTLDVKEKPLAQPKNFIGIDLGIVNLLTYCLGNQVAG